MLVTMRDRVKKAISDGHTLDEAIAANLTEGYDTWGTGFINDEKIVRVLYSAYME